MAKQLRVLIIEDSLDDTELLLHSLHSGGFEPIFRRVDGAKDMQEALTSQSWDLILADHSLPRFSADKALDILRNSGLDIPLIIVSGSMQDDLAVAAMRAGASDFIRKGHTARLIPAIERELGEAEIRRERRRVESELGRTEERIQLMVEGIKDYAVLMMDATGLVTDWNPGAQRMTGYKDEEIRGQSLNLLFTVESRQRACLEAWMKVCLNKGSHEDAGWLLRRNGERFWAVGVMTALHDSFGRLRGFAMILQDATEKKRATEEKERLYLQAQRANKMKDEFLTTLSHELRTPLNVILGHIELLEFEEPGSPEYLESLEAIQRNAKAQLQLVNDLLDVSRIISGKLILNVTEVDLGALVEEVLDSLRLAFESRNLLVHSVIEPGLEVPQGDRERLRQVLWNLFSNAIKFTPEGGRIEASVSQKEGTTHVTIKDNGKGIDPEFLPFIFERFRQEDSSSTRRYGGLGLGLAIVRHIVELHGGTLTVSSPGLHRGSSFTVSLPSRMVKKFPSELERQLPIYQDPSLSQAALQNLNCLALGGILPSREV